MNLDNIITPKLTICKSEHDSSKKQVLEHISQLVSEMDHAVKYSEILEALQARERLGSTGIAHGIAIPHARIQNLQQITCVVISLGNKIHFDSYVTDKVDLIFGLLVPKKEDQNHLEALAAITNKLKDKQYRKKLRDAKTNEELYQVAVG